MKEPYVGTVELLGGEIAEDVAAYFVESEQVPTVCALGVYMNRDQSVEVAGGYLLQLLPGAPEELIDRLEAAVQEAGTVTNLMQQGLTPREVILRVLKDMDVEFLEERPICYKCYCSRERVESTLISLGEKDLREIIADGEPISVGCQFCDVTYTFTPEELTDLLHHALA